MFVCAFVLVLIVGQQWLWWLVVLFLFLHLPTRWPLCALPAISFSCWFAVAQQGIATAFFSNVKLNSTNRLVLLFFSKFLSFASVSLFTFSDYYFYLFSLFSLFFSFNDGLIGPQSTAFGTFLHKHLQGVQPQTIERRSQKLKERRKKWWEGYRCEDAQKTRKKEALFSRAARYQNDVFCVAAFVSWNWALHLFCVCNATALP